MMQINVFIVISISCYKTMNALKKQIIVIIKSKINVKIVKLIMKILMECVMILKKTV